MSLVRRPPAEELQVEPTQLRLWLYLTAVVAVGTVLSVMISALGWTGSGSPGPTVIGGGTRQFAPYAPNSKACFAVPRRTNVELQRSRCMAARP